MSNIKDEYDSENPYGLEIQSDFHLSRIRVTIALLEEFVKDTDKNRILDVGCGKGQITKVIRQTFKNTKIDALDISERAISFAKNDITNVNFFVKDANEFSTKEILYDAIILNNIYEHVENPLRMLINLKTFLKDDGVFIISTPNRYHIRNVLRKLLGLKIAIHNYHITEYSIGQIYDHHRYAGLKVKKLLFPTFQREQFKVSDFIAFGLLQPILDNYYKILKSRTKLGSLLFIVSCK